MTEYSLLSKFRGAVKAGYGGPAWKGVKLETVQLNEKYASPLSTIIMRTDPEQNYWRTSNLYPQTQSSPLRIWQETELRRQHGHAEPEQLVSPYLRPIDFLSNEVPGDEHRY